MSRSIAVQVFSVLAIAVGLFVSYCPPPENGAAIWALVGGFLGYAARDLFAERGEAIQIGGFLDETLPPAGGGKQGGRALPGVLLALALAAAVLMSGCASLQQAGTAAYVVRPVVVGGSAICCEVEVKNGKEIAYVKARIEKDGDRYVVDLEEQGVQAFAGQAIAAGAQQAAIEQAAKVAAAAALAPLLPAAGAALASPGIGAAAVGAAAGVGAASLMSTPTPLPADDQPGLRLPK